MKTIIKNFIIGIAIAFLGVALGGVISYAIDRAQEKKTINDTSSALTDYSERFDNLKLAMDREMKSTKVDSTKNADSAINEFILMTFSIYEQAYRLVPEKRLLDKKDKALFNDVLKLLETIQDTQRQADKSRKNFLSGMGLTQVFVIEAKQYSILIDDYAIDTMKEVLKIDPNNQQAQKQLDQIYQKHLNQ